MSKERNFENLSKAMETLKDKKTPVEILYGLYKEDFLSENSFKICEILEKKNHGETWDAAIKAYRDRGHNVVRAIVDFDNYWAEKSKTPPGEHCEEA